MKITHLELNRIGHSQTTPRTFREKGSYIRMWFLFCFQVYGVLTSDSFEVDQQKFHHILPTTASTFVYYEVPSTY
jgi:hypothetical protein